MSEDSSDHSNIQSINECPFISRVQENDTISSLVITADHKFCITGTVSGSSSIRSMPSKHLRRHISLPDGHAVTSIDTVSKDNT